MVESRVKKALNQAAKTLPQSPEAVVSSSVPTARAVAELSDATLEAGPTLLELSEQAQRSQVSGAIFSDHDIMGPRLIAIEWFAGQFNGFGYRDEWLADAVNYMDRMAVGYCASSATGSPSVASPDALQEAREAAKQVMSCKEMWLAAVQVALKMSEAEAELDSRICDLVSPLASFGQSGHRCDRTMRSKILAAELKLVEKLNYELVVPNALHLTDRLAYEVCRAAFSDSRLHFSGMPATEIDQTPWAGLAQGRLPLFRGPPLKCKDMEDRRAKNAMPRRSLSNFQALARFLAEIAFVHQPCGIANHPGALAIAAVRLALHSCGGADPPEACVEELAKIQVQMLTSESQKFLPASVASLYWLWRGLPQSSPILQKWRARETDLGCALPSAPAKAQLPTELQLDCCSFSTPPRKQNGEDVRRVLCTSPTPPCSKQAPPHRASSLEPRLDSDSIAAKGEGDHMDESRSGVGASLKVEASLEACGAAAKKCRDDRKVASHRFSALAALAALQDEHCALTRIECAGNERSSGGHVAAWSRIHHRLLGRLAKDQQVRLTRALLERCGKKRHRQHILSIGTACSGTDCPVVVVQSLVNSLAMFLESNPLLAVELRVASLHLDFEFNCEKDQRKRDWADKEVSPRHRFLDVAELGGACAQEAGKSRPSKVPACDIFIFGFSCKP